MREAGSSTTPDTGSWVKLHGDYLFSYCMRRLNNRETAEDLVQETFLSAIRSKESFKGGSSERTWLTAILKNKIIDHYRKKDVLKDTDSYLTGTEEEFSSNFFEKDNGHWLKTAAPKSWEQGADFGLNQAEFDRILHMCVEKMPSKLVPVFIARFFDEEDSETICKVHGITPSNYWVIIHRAKVLIRACLEKNWFLSKQ